MKESRIIKWIIILPIVGVILTAFILTNVFISSINEKHNHEIVKLKTKHINNLKNKIQERIEHLAILLNNSYHRQIKNSQEEVKSIVQLGHRMIENIYNQNKSLPKEEIFKIINETMHTTRFFKNNSGYYFIYDLKDGKSISLPSAPQLVGKSLKNIIDVNGKNLFKSYTKILNKKGEGFDVWHWNKPNSTKKSEKIGYIKKFEPLNIAIGTAVYSEDIKQNIANNAIDSIKQLRFLDKSYVFVMTKEGMARHHKQKSIINVPLEKLDQKIQKNVTEIIQKAVNNKGSFIEYVQSKKLFNNQPISKKISYVKFIPSLNWIIGTGLYTHDLNTEIEKRTKLLKTQLNNDIRTISAISLFVTAIIIVLLLLLSKKINNRFNFYSKELENSNLELQLLNKGLEKKVSKQVKKIRQKDLMINQQSKLTAMGEMVGNIAHQWRQPLSAISTLASGIIIQKEMNMLKDEQLSNDLQNIVESTKTLSNTIDDFKNFYSNSKTITTFRLSGVISKVLNLIDANLKNHHITVIKQVDTVSITGCENELIQVLLNVLNNAKDALKQIENKRYIFINVYIHKKSVRIEIWDNAKGIDEKILPKVFNPYFTTKGSKEGTGIGLYMSKKILTQSLKGSIKVKNKSFTHNNVQFIGAIFTITLPTQ